MWLSKNHALTDYYVKNELVEKHPCTREENSVIAKDASKGATLDEEIYEYTDYSSGKGKGKYYRLMPTISSDEVPHYIGFKQIDLLSKIKNCLIFFVTVTVIGIVAAIFYYFYILPRNFR